MSKFKVPGCLRGCISVGCLSLLLIAIVSIVFFTKTPLDKRLFQIMSPGNTDRNKVDSTSESASNKPVAVKIVLMSDSENNNNAVSRVLDYAKSVNIKYVFHLGDLTHLGVPSSLEELSDLFVSSGLNVYTIPGDRDLWKSKGLTAYNKYFGNSYHYDTINGINFLFVDNANEYEGIDDDQWSFIEEHIKTTDFVLVHNPLMLTDVALIGGKVMGEYDIDVNKQRIKLLDLIRKSNVKAIFAGDQHYYSETGDEQKPSLKQYVLGTVNSQRSIQLPSFIILTVYDDHSYSVDKIILGN